MVDCIGTGCQREGLQAALAAVRGERDDLTTALREARAISDRDARDLIALRAEVERLNVVVAAFIDGREALRARVALAERERDEAFKAGRIIVEDCDRIVNEARARVAELEAALRQVEQMARFVIDWDWTDNDEEPVSDVAELRYAVERLDAVRAVVAQARATESGEKARD
jgi:hypothetical protein